MGVAAFVPAFFLPARGWARPLLVQTIIRGPPDPFAPPYSHAAHCHTPLTMRSTVYNEARCP